LKEQIRK